MHQNAYLRKSKFYEQEVLLRLSIRALVPTNRLAFRIQSLAKYLGQAEHAKRVLLVPQIMMNAYHPVVAKTLGRDPEYGEPWKYENGHFIVHFPGVHFYQVIRVRQRFLFSSLSLVQNSTCGTVTPGAAVGRSLRNKQGRGGFRRCGVVDRNSGGRTIVGKVPHWRETAGHSPATKGAQDLMHPWTLESLRNLQLNEVSYSDKPGRGSFVA